MIELERAISECQQAYSVFQQLAGRTDDALYQALAQVHALRFDMRTDSALLTSFDQLLQQHSPGKALNETLFLVKYAFFPHTVQPGPGHKGDITKASRYAKLINKALDEDINPTDFVRFARAEGIQRTAVSTRSNRRSRRHRMPLRRGAAPACRSSLARAVRFLPPMLEPLDTWIATATLATRMADLRGRAANQSIKLTLTVYLDHERAVVTGVSEDTWVGEAPDAAIRIPDPEPASVAEPTVHRVVPRPPPLPVSRLQRGIGGSRGNMYGIGPRRRRTADGFVWPSSSALR